MWIVLMCFIFLSTTRGFLLDPDHTANPTGKNQCLPIGTYLSDKEDLRHQMDKLQRENEQKLDILTSQLKSRLSAFEGTISENDRKNETLELASLGRIYKELGDNHTLLQEENKLLREKYGYLETEMKRLQNTTFELSRKVSVVEQMKSINQSLSLRAIQTKVHLLEQSTRLLTNNQNARNQDFLALYNVTQVTDNHLIEIQRLFKDELQSLKTSQNETLVRVVAIGSEVANNSKKVAVTACVSASQTFSSGAVKFSTVYLNVGIKDIATFKSSGKFICEYPGLYYIASHLRTTSGNYEFKLKKNNDIIAYSATDNENYYSTNPISAAVELQFNDTLYVQASSINIDSLHSCMSIVKIK